MTTSDRNVEMACVGYLDHFFDSYRNPGLQRNAARVLRLLAATGEPLLGQPAGWAAGIVYALATDARRACGVPGLLNAELEQFFGVSMGTIRRRAAQIVRSGAL